MQFEIKWLQQIHSIVTHKDSLLHDLLLNKSRTKS